MTSTDYALKGVQLDSVPLDGMQEKSRLFLGIDGGGSKTTAVLMDDAGVELGRGSGGPANIATMRSFALRASLEAAIAGARLAAGLEPGAGYAGVCAGMAGYSAEARRPEFIDLLQTLTATERCALEPDYVVAYWGATHGDPGIVVIAGTGAVVYGRNEEGKADREDGLGFLLGDRGSGFNLGLRVLRYTLEQWKRGERDPLTEAVLGYTGATSQEQIVQWLYGDFSPARVAALAPLVGHLAEEGDPASRWHVAEMARRLRHSVRQVRHRLWLDRNAPIYPLGGLWNLGSFFRDEFTDPGWQGTSAFPMEPETLSGGPFFLSTPRSDAAYGAALCAQQRVG